MARTKKTFRLDDATVAIIDESTRSGGEMVETGIQTVHELGLDSESRSELRRLVSVADTPQPFRAARRLIERAQRDAAQGLIWLRGRGWAGREVMAVIAAEAGVVVDGVQARHTGMATNMREASTQGDLDLATWGITPHRWGDLVGDVSSSEELAAHVDSVARLLWAAPGGRLEMLLREGLP